MLPADVRKRQGLVADSKLVLVDCADGIALLTRDQLERRIRDALAGQDLVTELREDHARDAAGDGSVDGHDDRAVSDHR